MAKKKAESGNSYEEARKQRLEDNLKRFEDLGILKISKTLTEISNSGSKQHHGKPRPKKTIEVSELRRSSRERNVVTSYRETDIDLRGLRTSRIGGSSVLVKEGRLASYEERLEALEKAEKLQSELSSGYPSFVKSMLRSHVYSCFWLGLPSMFCKDHLPPTEMNMVLEDENGSEYDAIYLGRKTGLSGGWRAFALDHQLDDGDALVFELTKPTRFKVYIIKVCYQLEEADKELVIIEAKHADESKKSDKIEDDNGSASRKLERKTESMKRAERAERRRSLRSTPQVS